MESEENSSTKGVAYECINCKAKVSAEQLAITPEIKCPMCGYRVLKKVRPSIVKHVKSK